MKGRIRPRNLRQQVTSERRRRNIVFFTLVTLVFLNIFIALLFGKMGFLKYLELNKTKNSLNAEICTLQKDNAALKSHINALKNDDYYIEKYAREEYGLAKPGEYIFQFKGNGR